jgi:heptosyltransferase-2
MLISDKIHSALQRFLVIQTASIGDVILATAVIEKLHSHFPGAAIDFMTKKGNEALFKGHPYLNKLLIWEKSNHKYRNLFRLLKEVRKTRYDYLINLQRFAATGLFTVLSKANHTSGFDKNPFSRWFTYSTAHRISIEDNIHETERNQVLITPFTDNRPSKPRLYPSPDDYKAVDFCKTKPYLCIAPASLWFTKQFPESQWVSLIKTVPAQFAVLLLGSQSDFELCERIRKESGNEQCLNLAGRFSLLQSAALMQDAVMNYVNDSSPMHLASAVNASTTAVFCSTVPQFGFGPLSDNSVVIETTKKLTCRPCGLHGHRECPEKHFECATTITTQQLLSTLNYERP